MRRNQRYSNSRQSIENYSTNLGFYSTNQAVCCATGWILLYLRYQKRAILSVFESALWFGYPTIVPGSTSPADAIKFGVKAASEWSNISSSSFSTEPWPAGIALIIGSKFLKS